MQLIIHLRNFVYKFKPKCYYINLNIIKLMISVVSLLNSINYYENKGFNYA